MWLCVYVCGWKENWHIWTRVFFILFCLAYIWIGKLASFLVNADHLHSRCCLALLLYHYRLYSSTPQQVWYFRFAFCLVYHSCCVGTDIMLAELPSCPPEVLALAGFLYSPYAPACCLYLSYYSSPEFWNLMTCSIFVKWIACKLFNCSKNFRGRW